MARFLLVLGTVGLVMGVGALGYGAFTIFDQHARLTRCQTVEATIIESRVEFIYQQHISEYRPVVRFKYWVNGGLYDCANATPGNESGRSSWANRIVSSYPPGATATAYFDPQDPAYAFLVKRYDAMPYTVFLFGPLMLVGGVVIIREARRSRLGPPPPRDAGDGWYQLVPPMTLRRATLFFVATGVVWQIVGAPAWLHYLSVRGQPTPLLFLIYLPVYLLTGLLLLGMGAYAAAVLAKVDDAVVLIAPPRPRTGEILAIRVEQNVRRPVVVKALEVRLICGQAQRMWIQGAPQEHTEKIFTAAASALENHAAEAGELQVADFQLLIPSALPPSTPSAARTKVRHVWELKLKTGLRGWLPYPDKFALTVEQGDAGFPEDGADPDVVDAEMI